MNNEPTIDAAEEIAPGVSCGASYRGGWHLMAGSFGILFATTLVFFVIRAPMELMDDLAKFMDIPFWIVLWSILFSILVVIPMSMSYNWVFLKAVRKETISVKDLAAVFARNYWPAVGAGLLKLVIVIAGLILLILPGIYFGARLAFVDYLVIDRKMGVRESFRTSWAMTGKHQGTVICMVFLAIPVILAGLLALIVGVLVAMMWIAAAFAVLFHRIDPLEGTPAPEEIASPSGMVVVLSSGFAVFLLFGVFAWGHPKIPGPEKIPSPSEPTSFGGHYYQVFEESEPIEWLDAKARCEEMGGHLVIINDAAENDFLTSIGAANGFYHLGASDKDKEGEWRWIDGTPMTYSNWHPDEPNNYGGDEDYLNAIFLRWPKWNDGGSEGNGFICEWDAVPDGNSVELPPAQPEASEPALPSNERP